MRRILTIGSLFGLILCTLWLAAPAPVSRAQIIIDPPPTAWPPPWPEPQPQRIDQVKIQEQRVDVTIDEQLAHVELTQILRNDSSRPIEGTYVFPLPENAAISDFQMTVDGEVIEGEILRAGEARQTYEAIVRQRRDPALLEYLGRDLFQISVFPIPAQDSRTLTLAYTQVIDQRDGLNHFRYPLLTRQITQAPIETLVLNIALTNQAGLRTIYSPDVEIAVDRQSDKRATVSYEASNVTPSGDFVLYFGSDAEAVGVNILSYNPAGEDGYFLMLAAPSVEVAAADVVARDLLMVLDVSGSMEGAKLEQAQAAARYVVEQLNPDDRFNLLSFSSGVRLWEAALQTADDENRAAAEEWIDELQATGSTDINRALLEALAQVDRSEETRPTYLIFLTDGLPTQGERDIERILANVDNNLSADIALRLFAFGVGYDVNTTLLDTLSSDLGGRSSYVRPNERIDEEVSHFYNGIRTPVLSNVSVDFGEDFLADELYPYPLPDLFAGEQLVLAGRYRDGGSTDITLQGEVNGKPITYRYPAQSFVEQGGEPQIARLWASRKIGDLLQAVRRNGPDQELIDAIIDLSLQFGIVTPYTSSYVPEPMLGNMGAVPLAAPTTVDLYQADGDSVQSLNPSSATAESEGASNQLSALRATSGEAAVTLSDQVNAMTEAEVVRDEESVRYVAGRSFVAQSVARDDGEMAVRWVDTGYDEEMALVTVLFGSDCYFSLLENAAIRDWLTVDAEMIVVIDGEAGKALLITADPAAVDDSTVCPD